MRGFLFDSFEPERRRSALAAWQPWPWVSSSWSSAQVGEDGMGTMGCVELVVEKLLGVSPSQGRAGERGQCSGKSRARAR